MLSYEDILESLAEGLIAVGLDSRVTVFNQSAEKMTELSRSLVIGKTAREAFGPSTRLVEMLEKTMKDGRLLMEFDEKIVRRFSGVLPVGISTSPVFDSGGSQAGAAAIIRDLSGLKSIEEGSSRKERLAYLGAFAANLAHEIKNPLSGMRGAAQLLARRVKDEKTGEYARVIMSEADRLNGILEGMLDFARPARLNRRAVNIHRVLDSVAILLKDSLGVTALVREYDPSLPDVFGDEGQLTQVFLNIVKNAAEAVTRDGKVGLSTRMVTDFHLSGGGAAGKMAAVEIRDNGCGMSEDDLDKVFTPFFTTKPKGSGLGMPITLKIVKEHGGFMKIDSKHGKGTSVTVFLPMAQAEG